MRLQKENPRSREEEGPFAHTYTYFDSIIQPAPSMITGMKREADNTKRPEDARRTMELQSIQATEPWTKERGFVWIANLVMTFRTPENGR